MNFEVGKLYKHTGREFLLLFESAAGVIKECKYNNRFSGTPPGILDPKNFVPSKRKPIEIATIIANHWSEYDRGKIRPLSPGEKFMYLGQINYRRNKLVKILAGEVGWIIFGDWLEKSIDLL